MKNHLLVSARTARPARLYWFTAALLCCVGVNVGAEPAQFPLFMGGDISAPPLTMIVMSRDHSLYYEAYNDASDLNGDGVLDVGYNPNMVDADGEPVDYFGYFDSYLCYTYNNGRFEPAGTTSNKKCAGQWSGDFLNYLTTARIDALRKVLYGGHRIIDEGDETDTCMPDNPEDCLTVLERSYIPQDAHSWGKEYKSIEHDGYDIADYAPLSEPAEGMRHLFANTTLLKSGDKEPLLRVLPNSKFRIWEWVAIERPVAWDKCDDGSRKDCETSGGSDWQTLPSSFMENLTQTTFKHTGSHPGSAAEFDTMVTTYAIPENFCGTRTVSTIDGSGNPFAGENDCTNEDYLTIFDGQLVIPEDGTYTFGVNGDDAVDFLIDSNADGIFEPVVGWYGGHGAGRCRDHAGNMSLDAGTYNFRFRHEEVYGGDSYQLCNNEVVPSSTMTDYVVRVKVCASDYPDSNCTNYPAGTMKPTGVLQRYGETDEMMFGLLSGSYGKNTSGGVLRKNIESFSDEIDPATGQFTDHAAIVDTINKLRIVDFRMDQNYQYDGGWLTTAPMIDSSKNFSDWGNPLGEMLYETLRYFSGKENPTSDYMPTVTAGKERVTLRDYSGSSYMELPVAEWDDPYTREEDSALHCSPGAQLVISDVYPSYDTDEVPGSVFESISGDVDGLDAAAEADDIWAAEYGESGFHFIGQSGTEYDGAPTAKIVSGLGSIRGLSPNEPTKQGGYYSSGIAKFGYENDLRDDVEDKQDINTFAVALASPLPRIEIPIDGSKVTLVPFAKSVGGSSINAAKGRFQPTNTIVDFFVSEFANTATDGSDADPDVNEGRPFIKFRINYEDVEQGADHDMDAIVLYELAVNEDNTLTVKLTSEYAAGGIMHHLGYVISGTTKDGLYLEVRDEDTSESNDPDYFLDTPDGQDPGFCDEVTMPTACNSALPLYAERTFSVGEGAQVATVLNDPLWYAAKYGSEGNEPENLRPDGSSPNYFLVTNAGKLQEQLEEAFESIILLGESSASAIAVNTARVDEGALAFLASFATDDWSGSLRAVHISENGELGEDEWSTDVDGLPDAALRSIFTFDPGFGDNEPIGIPFVFDSLTAAQRDDLGADASEQEQVLDWLRGESVTGLRVREKVLGDIVNSNPLYVGKPKNFGYAGEAEYETWRQSQGGVTPMLYVGANDGMLHAFEAATGAEVFAYVPNALFPELSILAQPSYGAEAGQHRYYVDGSPNVSHAYIGLYGGGAAWRRVLIGTLGAGGRGVFALDVTDPDSFSEENVLWELSSIDHPELGYMVGQMSPKPMIGRLSNGTWVAVFGNGYDSEEGAYLFVVDVATGEVLNKISVNADSENGLSGAVVMIGPDYNLAGAYAGDVKGNLWKFDFTESATGTLASNGAPLFVATDSEGNRQPITSTVNTVKHPEGGNVIVFGTGKFMDTSDPSTTSVQTAYGVWDNAKLQESGGSFSWVDGTSTGRAELAYRGFVFQELINSVEWRVVSGDTIDWSTQRGWYLDLLPPTGNAEGERVIDQPQIISSTGEALYTSIVPTGADDPCMAGTAYRWIFLLDALTGNFSEWTRFDVDGGGFSETDLKTIDLEDGEQIKVPFIGYKSGFGGGARTIGAGNTDVILDPSGEDGLQKLLDRGPPRHSWRQLR